MSMTGNEIRQAYLDFFKDKGHLIMPSAPLIPQDDPSILWINAGMAPFKPYFDGRKTAPRNRIATSQKCIRTNDIENVGKTVRHHTFFEMLGNFSFGDYFKEEAISWAWEFVTEVLKLPEERLWITIYQNDDEAFQIWHNKIGLSEDRIIRMGKKDNFWEIGTGPCGPCSEIHYDRGEEYGTGDEDVIGGEGDRFLEIWNLVFTQYDKSEDGEYLPLPNKNIDTGMGLERVASILQDCESNYETDLLKPMIEYIAKDTGINYTRDEDTITAFRVIADHIRGITMAVFDGALPSNEGRGYVIRRILRRAVRYAGKLGYQEPFLYRMVPVVIDTLAAGYPELSVKEEHISRIVKAEEERFLQTLDQGLSIIQEMLGKLKASNQNTLSGKDAFKLYDTYGFPLDLTKDILEEADFSIDEDEFKKEMEKQRERARSAREDIGFSGIGNEILYSKLKKDLSGTNFVGYGDLKNEAEILAIIKDGKSVDRLQSGEKGEVILNQTPFYAESGGQIGDQGILRTAENIAEVFDTRKKAELIVHSVEVKKGVIKQGSSVETRVYADLRKATARNHSATHLLHKALKEVLGEHVNQSGSLVEANRLRFDFNHFSAMTAVELDGVEKKVNQVILENLRVETIETEIDKAREMGATALFGEKYGKNVRVVTMGDYSRELCGGTHIAWTAEIGSFKIISEGSVAAGIRRIEAVTGMEVINYVNKERELIAETASLLKTDRSRLLERVKALLNQQKELENEVKSMKDRLANLKVDDLLNNIQEINGISLLTAGLKGIDNEGLRKLSDQLNSRMGSGVIVLASDLGQKVIFVASVSEDLLSKGYHAGKLIGQVARIAGGGGGGRPDMAQAGGQKVEKIPEALAEAKKIIENK
ncbi:alanine--tRNA ligase [Iocasia frigidifontis]|nr:alanine--tRNA ligase [Iocasia fonsfrigidae]